MVSNNCVTKTHDILLMCTLEARSCFSKLTTLHGFQWFCREVVSGGFVIKSCNILLLLALLAQTLFCYLPPPSQHLWVCWREDTAGKHCSWQAIADTIWNGEPRRTKKALRSKWCQRPQQAVKARTAAGSKSTNKGKPRQKENCVPYARCRRAEIFTKK